MEPYGTINEKYGILIWETHGILTGKYWKLVGN
jgi:hypothetical protein